MVASTCFAILITGIGYFIGATIRFFLNPQNAPNAFAAGKPVFDSLMPEFLVNVIPESLLIIILLLILSASMSTLAALVLTLAALVLISSSSIVKDFYHGFINKEASDKKLTLLMRIFSAFFVLLSVIMAYYKPATIVGILGISWGAIGAVFLGPFIWGLFTKRASKHGAIASAVLGLAICLYLYIDGMPSPQAGTIGMMVSLALNPIVSLFVPNKA